MGLFSRLRPPTESTPLLAELLARVERLESERSDQRIEHAERMEQLAALYSRMSTRYQRLIQRTAEPETKPTTVNGGDVLSLRRSMGK